MKKLKLLSAAAALCLLAACSAQTPDPDASPERAVLTQPPELTVTVGEEACTALRGTFTWNYALEDGSYAGVCSDSLHPLDCQAFTPALESAGERAVLTFSLEPDTLAVQCWPEDAWGDTQAQGEELTVEGDVFLLKEGGWIYQVRAAWDRMPDFEGDGSYSFFVRSLPK